MVGFVEHWQGKLYVCMVAYTVRGLDSMRGKYCPTYRHIGSRYNCGWWIRDLQLGGSYTSTSFAFSSAGIVAPVRHSEARQCVSTGTCLPVKYITDFSLSAYALVISLMSCWEI